MHLHHNTKEPPKIVLSGTPLEIGLQHGAQLRAQIESQLSVYRTMFQYTSKLSWDAVLDLAGEFRTTIARLTPELLEEMQGIADGAGVTLLDIIALNCRSEISFGKFSDGCTSLSLHRSGRGRILAQNWDFTTQLQNHLAMVEIIQPGKPVIYMVTEAGLVGKIGFNSAGVGVCLNAIRAHPCLSSKLPIHLALRLCLESVSVEAALERLSALGGVASSQHILIADRTAALGLELSPLGDDHLPEDEYGVVTHTNHFLVNRRVIEPPWLSGSPVRLARVRALLREIVGSGVLEDESANMVGTVLRDQIFSDTCDGPQSICWQEDPAQPEIVRTATLFNIVMRLEEEEGALGAEVVFGRPGSGMESSVNRMPWR
ncbi:putative acyl-CoA:6-aminopenicillanic-acid-acyltransferase [Aspergillus saccharolyticus JOP 1030-1]|uniref:AAT-domain-containing protein n=1 Tax=Aspergillus saccharolyticus JOP 1030-1 TaxID=1450539 RepID=A0A319AFI7_9EURO|nr:AAT-domain-containing protein [Aspergillus saccharolyticus JOP 1030-1]PYH45542.1 AAT-domain-containing protein [Aspergillus saccharolyticus JOP 1030-1]